MIRESVFKIGDRIRVPKDLREHSMPDRIKFMGDGRVEVVTEVDVVDYCRDFQIQRVSIDLFPPTIGSGWFELAPEEQANGIRQSD